MLFPTPAELRLPAKYKDWRPNQPKAIQDALDSVKRFIVQVQRQGEGKSVTSLAQGLIDSNHRWGYVTATKGLQDQLLDDGENVGLVDIRGKSTYECDGLPGHNCAEGSVAKCPYKGTSMCNHSFAKQSVLAARMFVTNYSCLISSNKYAQGLGPIDVLLCDEAHSIPSEIEKAVNITLGEHEICEDLKRDWPDYKKREDMPTWKHWAMVTRTLADKERMRCKAEIERSGRGAVKLAKKFNHYTNLVRRTAEIATCKPEDWIVDEWQHGYKFDPINAAPWTEKLLYKAVPKVILTSGSITRKTTEQMDLNPAEIDFFEYASDVNPDRTPIMYIPTVKVNRFSQPWELKKLVRRIDEIFEARCDRKGIIHTSSFKIRDFIVANSKYARFMVSNYVGNGDITSAVIEEFKRMDPPGLLISPSITTGYDFPYDMCRYQIVAKLNYPYAGSKIERARERLDPERGSAHAILALQQAVGRGDRANDDFQEVFILDDAFPYLTWKYASMFSSAFLICVKTVNKIPKAPVIRRAA